MAIQELNNGSIRMIRYKNNELLTKNFYDVSEYLPGALVMNCKNNKTVTFFHKKPLLPGYQFVAVAGEAAAAVAGVEPAEDTVVAGSAAYAAGDGLETTGLAAAAAPCPVPHLKEKGVETCHPNLK
jgi:hypothetical protein